MGLGVEAATGLKPLYLGQVGLRPSNTTIVDGTASFMAQLKNEKLIPSLSYGYTAVELYRESRSFRVKFIKPMLPSRPAAGTGKPYAWSLRLLALRFNLYQSCSEVA